MLWEMIKKQALIFIRNPQQLFLLILLPVLLIVILSVSLSSFMDGDTLKIEAKIALIHDGDEKEQIDQFTEKIESMQMPDENKQAIISSAKQLPLITLLRETFQAIDSMEIVELPRDEKQAAIKNDEYTVVIDIPENFLLDSYEALFFDEGNRKTIKMYENKGKQFGVTAVKSILEHFEQQLTMTVFLTKENIDVHTIRETFDEKLGKIGTVGKSKKIGSKEYYTIGMAVMNTLFIASAVGSLAYMEKQSHVFNRIILSNMSRWSYFIGIFISGTIFSLLQLLVIFSFSWLVYDVTWNIQSLLIVTLCLAFSVGGVSVLLAAISYRVNSEAAINFFSTTIVALFALLGGSFFPIGDYSNFFQVIGDFTPNGAAMTTYLSVLRGDNIVDSSFRLIYLLCFTAMMIIIAVISFPKRGQI